MFYFAYIQGCHWLMVVLIAFQYVLNTKYNWQPCFTAIVMLIKDIRSLGGVCSCGKGDGVIAMNFPGPLELSF